MCSFGDFGAETWDAEAGVVEDEFALDDWFVNLCVLFFVSFLGGIQSMLMIRKFDVLCLMFLVYETEFSSCIVLYHMESRRF